MALPSTGSISASQINTELGRTSSASFSMNGSAERGLAGKSSGQISFNDFRGKSAIVFYIPSPSFAPLTDRPLFTGDMKIWSSGRLLASGSGITPPSGGDLFSKETTWHNGTLTGGHYQARVVVGTGNLVLSSSTTAWTNISSLTLFSWGNQASENYRNITIQVRNPSGTQVMSQSVHVRGRY